MSVFAGSIVIDRPLDVVWAYIADPKNLKGWGRAVSSSEVLTPGPLAVGSRLRMVMQGQSLDMQVVAMVPDRMFALEFTSGGVSGTIASYTVEAEGSGTKLTRELVLKTRGVWRLLRIALRLRERFGRQVGIENIKHILEAKPAGGAKT